MSDSWQEMTDGLCPLQREHLRVIIPPLSSLPKNIEASTSLSVGCLLYNVSGLSIKSQNGCKCTLTIVLREGKIKKIKHIIVE